jgi:hypothetical protein
MTTLNLTRLDTMPLRLQELNGESKYSKVQAAALSFLRVNIINRLAQKFEAM